MSNSERRIRDDLYEMVSEQRDYSELLYQLALRDLKLRYKQTVMGFGWAVFMPVLNTIIFTVVFTRVARVDTPLPYVLFAYSGLLAWNLTASSLRFAVNSLTSNTQLVTKVYFPREIFPAAAVLVSLVDTLIGGTILVALMWYYDIGVHATALLLPVVVLVQVTFTFAVALVVAMANLFYRDVKYVFEIVLTIWMFGTSVLYPVTDLGGWTGLAMRLNPMTPIVDAYRSVLLMGHLPSSDFAITAGGSLLLLVACWVTFHRAEFRFAENV